MPHFNGVAEVALGAEFTCARKVDGSVWCWGFNANGEIGAPSSDTCKDLNGKSWACSMTPIRVPIDGAVGIATMDGAGCARKIDGTVWCWGILPGGSHKQPPTPLPNVTDVAKIAAHGMTGVMCARRNDGTVWCWGSVDHQPSVPPTAIQGLDGVTQISVSRVVCARKVDGTAWCWGPNFGGQLGDGTMIDKYVPTPVVDLGKVAAVATGGLHSCARDKAGSVWCWGVNREGELGAASNTYCDAEFPACSTTPIVVPGLSNVAELALGTRYSCARTSQGSVCCWGANYDGQLGDGTTTNRLWPTPVAF